MWAKVVFVCFFFWGSSFSSCPLNISFPLVSFLSLSLYLWRIFSFPCFHLHCWKFGKVLPNTFFSDLDVLIQLPIPCGHLELSTPLTNLIFHPPQSSPLVILNLNPQKTQLSSQFPSKKPKAMTCSFLLCTQPINYQTLILLSYLFLISIPLHPYLHLVYASDSLLSTLSPDGLLTSILICSNLSIQWWAKFLKCKPHNIILVLNIMIECGKPILQIFIDKYWHD